MAKCDLAIELDDPKSVHPGGGTITGVVRVNVDKTVTTKGLEVYSCWATHGRGNVASETFETQTLYTGEWKAGDQLEYRFELPIGHWPPSYHGNYLNVDHYVKARAKIPWGFDPKASSSFLMRPVGGPEVTEKLASKSGTAQKIGCVIFAIFIGVFFAVFVGGFVAAGAPPIFMLFFAIVPLIAATYWFFRHFLPKYALGSVEYKLDQLQVSPGDEVHGELVIQPRKSVKINGIKMTFSAEERVVSGSGSNRTTHKNVFFEKETTLQGEGVLQLGQTHRIPVKVQLPNDAPYSIDLSDNDLIWSTTLRVDIPRWPDWVSTKAIQVVPSGNESVIEKTSATPVPDVATAQGSVAPAGQQATPADSGESTITFAETVKHFWALKDNPDSANELAEAVTGLSFDMEAFVERRLLYSGEEDPHLYKDGYAIWAHFTDPPLPLVLYVPHDLADDFEQIGRDLWRGRGTIVGWDSQHRRLQVKL